METIRSWNHPVVKEVRGMGMMIGVDIDGEAWPVLESVLSKGLLLPDPKRSGSFLPISSQKKKLMKD